MKTWYSSLSRILDTPGNTDRLIPAIRQQTALIEGARKHIADCHHPLIPYCQVAFFNGTRLLLHTESNAVVSRFRLEKNDLLVALKRLSFFSNLIDLRIKLVFNSLSPQETASEPRTLSRSAGQALRTLKEDCDNNKALTQALNHLLTEHSSNSRGEIVSLHPEAILFDLDGTLIDSAADITTALNAMRAHFKLPPVSTATTATIIGKGLPVTIRHLLRQDWSDNYIEQVYPEAYDVVVQAYSQCCGSHTRIYPGVTETLHSLATQGIPMAVVTNKEQSHTEQVLAKTGLSAYFRVIIGGDATGAYKPDPEPLRAALKQLQASSPQATVLIGDSESDIQAARALQMPVIAVNYGYNHGTPIASLYPDYIISHMDELLSLISCYKQ